MLYFTLIILITISLIPINNKFKLAVGFSTLAVVTLLRYGIGADYFSYKYIYDIIQNKSLQQSFAHLPNIDKGFLSLFFILGRVGLNYQVAISLIVLILVAVMMLWIINNSENTSVSVLLYFVSFFMVWQLSAIRQGIVVVISSCILFSNNKVSCWVKVLTVIILSQFHSSALFLFIFIFLEYLPLTKKKIFVLLLISLVITNVPFEFILAKLDFIPWISRFALYIDNSSGLISFSSLSRLGLFFIVYLHYDKLETNLYYKKLMDIYLIGIVIYFVLNFSDLISGRLFYYSFATSIILFPAILALYSGKRLKIATLLICIYASLFGIKEINSIKTQTKVSTNSIFMPTTTVFNKNQYTFDTYFYQYTQMMDYYRSQMNNFSKDKIQSTIVKPDQNMHFIPVYSIKDESYFIMNNKGQAVTHAIFPTKPMVYKHYLRLEDTNSIYYDLLTEHYIDDKILIDDIIENTQVEQALSFSERLITFEELPSKIKDLIEFPNSVSDVILREYHSENKDYSTVVLLYYGEPISFMLNEQGQPLLDSYYLNLSDINRNGFFTAKSANSVSIFYQDGTLIWIQEY